MSVKVTQKEFEDRCRKIHGDFYDYTLDTYKGMGEVYSIGCPVHGIFKMKASCHTHLKQGCNECQLENVRKVNKEKHTKSIQESHSGKYSILDWSGFKNMGSSLPATCTYHGKYLTTVQSLLRVDYGDCPRCKQLKEASSFLAKAKKVHGDKYTYNKEDYVCSRTLMPMVCSAHNIRFEQRPSAHLQGQGCPDCGKEDAIKNSTLSFSEFLSKSKDVHGDFYDYSDTVYKNCQTPCNITCRIHGEFKIRPNNHFHGFGCPLCAKEVKRLDYEKAFLDKVRSDERYMHLDFSKSKYSNNRTRVDVYCKTHEEWFTATPNRLLDVSGVCGCKVCASISQNRWSLSALSKIPNIRKKVGHFYTGKISKLTGLKLGITGNTKDRLYGYNTDLGVYNEHSFEYSNYLTSDYYTCSVIEVVVKKMFKERLVKHGLSFGGKNEIYDVQGHQLFEDLMDGVWDIHFTTLANIVTSNKDPEITSMVKFLKGYYDKK